MSPISGPTQLNQEFMNRYWFLEVCNQFKGWQKEVFIVKNSTGDKVVIKTFRFWLWAREQREIEILREYNDSDWIAKILELWDIDWEYFILEEFIEWDNLEDEKIQHDYIGNIQKVKDFIRWFCKTISPLWNKWIVHRDIKPNNIIVFNDKVNILDFWIATYEEWWTVYTTVWNQPKTFLYAAPEQVHWQKEFISVKTDFFCLWILAYKLYYWVLPFWNCPDEIAQNFQQNYLNFYLKPDDDLNNFFTFVFQKNIYERPKDINVLINLI